MEDGTFGALGVLPDRLEEACCPSFDPSSIRVVSVQNHARVE